MKLDFIKSLFNKLCKKELLFFIGCIVALVSIEVIQNKKFKKSLEEDFGHSVKSESLSDDDNTAEDSLEQSDPQVSVANYILADSVLSAVRSYHVESERVTIDFLFDKMLDTLNNLKDIKADLNGEKFYLARKGKPGISFEIGQEKQYSNFLTTLLRSCFYIKKHAPKSLPTRVQQQISQDNYQQPISFVLDKILAKLDPHSAMLSKEVYKELRDGTEGSFGGLGVLVGVKDNMLNIMKVLPNGPAEEAGLQVGDRIVRIGTENTYGRGIESLIDHMRGAPGSKVKLTILNEKDNAPRKYELVRKIIDVSSVETSIEPIDKTDKFALFLKIDSFSVKTSEEVELAIIAAKKKLKDKLGGIILDMRSNPGGLLDQAVKTADLFVKKGVLVSTDGRLEDTDYATERKKYLDYPITVLLNQDSASASEILAGALQDHNRAIIIGQPSFGKGSVQTIFELPNDTALKLTIARYYTPNGHSIQNSGIVPDIWIQGLHENDKNVNIFGGSRYQGENHLANHLNKPTSTSKIKDYLNRFKIFRLFSGQEDSVDSELEVSKILFSEVDKQHVQLTDGFDRASFWYSLAVPKLKNYSIKYTKNALSYLSHKHDVNWQGTSSVYDLDLQIDDKAMQSIVLGEEVLIPWEIKNNKKSTATRVSVYMNPLFPGIPSQEVLIGSLEPNAIKKGAFKIKARAPKGQTNYPFMAGYTIDAIPMRKNEQKKSLFIKDASQANISISYLVDDEQSRSDGYIEPSEKASLVVSIKNDGERAVKNLNYRLINLSGKQLVFSDQTSEIDVLKPHEVRKVRIPIQASSSLIDQNLSVGFSIDGIGLLATKHQICSFKTTKNSDYLSSLEPVKVAH